MSESVRLHHPQFASCNYVVELPELRTASVLRACFACSRPNAPVTHQYRAIHLRLDAAGDVFVAPGILELLKKVPTMAGLEVVPGRNAPAQLVGAVDSREDRIVLAGREFFVPKSTKHDAVARMRRPFQPYVEAVREKLDRAATAAKAERSSTFILGKRRD